MILTWKRGEISKLKWSDGLSYFCISGTWVPTKHIFWLYDKGIISKTELVAA